MSGPIRFDWPLILQRIDEAGLTPASSCLICINEATRQLFLAFSERLKWRASYRVEDYDYADWDTLQALVDEGIYNMTACDALIASITTNIVNQVNYTITQQGVMEDMCCYLEGAGAPLEEPDPSDEPPGVGTEAGERCARAQQAHENGLTFLRQAFNLAEALGGLTAGIIASIILGLALALPAVLLGAIIAAIVAIVADDITSDAELQWEAIKHDVACCFAHSDTASEAKTCIHEAIDLNIENTTVRALFKAMFNQEQVNRIWDGAPGYDGVGYSPLYCNDCVSGNVAAISWVISDWYSEFSGNNSQGVASKSGYDDWISGEKFVPHADIDEETELPKRVLVYNSTLVPDYTAVPGYQSSWKQFSGFTPGGTQPYLWLGLSNGFGGPHDFILVIDSFMILLKSLSGEFTWIPATITLIENTPAGVPDANVSSSSISFPLAEYPGNDSAFGVRPGYVLVSVSYAVP